MKNTIEISRRILSYLLEFSDKENREPSDTKEFVSWMSAQIHNSNTKISASHSAEDINLELTFLLIMQHKHYKMYCKKILQHTEINTPDGYSFLYHLNLADSFRKMEIINMHLLEAPSGIEVIKRLLKKQLIEEFDDPDDKRAKRIRITDKGRKTVESIAPKMQTVYAQMAADLQTEEKLQLISFLKRFNDYHANRNKL